MLTRIYGTAFFKKAELDAYLERLEQARARDHRKLGRELDLFTFSRRSRRARRSGCRRAPRSSTSSSRSIARMQQERGYVEVKTPLLYDVELWKTSGHWGKYRENMFVAEYEDREFGLKPMNCPGHAHLFRMQQLVLPRPAGPLRRARACCTATSPAARCTACCACATSSRTTPTSSAPRSRSQDEVAPLPGLRLRDLRDVRLPGRTLELSTRPDEPASATDEMWDQRRGRRSQSALEDDGLDYELNEGDGAFYGPKIDLHMTDSLGRSWQLGTVQLDYTMPERFELTYTGADNAEHRPVMIHRALFGSFERFIGILHRALRRRVPAVARAGAGDRAADRRPPRRGRRARRRRRCARPGCAPSSTTAPSRSGRKIRDAELQKVPYMLVVGDREAEEGTVAVRRHGEGDEGSVPVDEFVARLARDARRSGDERPARRRSARSADADSRRRLGAAPGRPRQRTARRRADAARRPRLRRAPPRPRRAGAAARRPRAAHPRVPFGAHVRHALRARSRLARAGVGASCASTATVRASRVEALRACAVGRRDVRRPGRPLRAGAVGRRVGGYTGSC